MTHRPASAADRLLAIDVGTQSVRALLFDPSGESLASARVPIEPYVAPEPGWAEQDPEVWWSAMAEGCRRLLADPAASPTDAIAGLALTTQRGTVVPCDRDGRPLRPAIVWLDRRRTEGLPPVGGALGVALRLAGVAQTVATFQADAEANWLATHEPATWARTERFLLLSGFLTHRLVGRFVDSDASQVGYVPFDHKRRAWARPGAWQWKVAPFRPEQLPEVVPPTTPLGGLTADAAEWLGLPAGLPVVAAAGDKACEVLGAGSLAPSVGALSYGTVATVDTTHDRYVEPIPYVPAFPAAVPGRWDVEVQVYRGFWLVDWFKREFGDREVSRAAALGVEPEQLLDDLVEGTPPGSMGLLLQPTWSPGVRVPGPEAKGAIVGFGEVHTRAHVYRAILEGLAYALRDGLEQSEKRTGVAATELRVSGGGARSRAVLQLTADVFGRPAARPHTTETSGLGAAIDLALGLGLHRDAETAVREMTRVAERRDPDPRTVSMYDDLYREVYRRVYPALRPLYAAIARITGYPPLG